MVHVFVPLCVSCLSIVAALVVERYRAFVPIFEQEATNYFASKFGQGGQFDLFDCMAELTILTASRCLLGKEVCVGFDSLLLFLMQKVSIVVDALGSR